MNINFEKGNGLVPAVIQDACNLQILMTGFMNAEALKKTLETGIVTFYSRSKQRLWTKGESSGNYLFVKNIETDCDRDTLLIQAEAPGPVCHTGSRSCFGPQAVKGFLYRLEKTINQRIDDKSQNSYTYKLYQKGIAKVAQKVGEEAVETVIEAMRSEADRFENEAADLLYHLLILLKSKNMKLEDIERVLAGRMK